MMHENLIKLGCSNNKHTPAFLSEIARYFGIKSIFDKDDVAEFWRLYSNMTDVDIANIIEGSKSENSFIHEKMLSIIDNLKSGLVTGKNIALQGYSDYNYGPYGALLDFIKTIENDTELGIISTNYSEDTIDMLCYHNKVKGL